MKKLLNKNTVTCALFGVVLLVMSALCFFMPRGDFSVSERRPLKKMPPITAESLLNGRFMSEFEGYTTDNFPFRDAFRSVKAVANRYLFNRGDNNGIYLADGHLSDADYPMHEDKLDYALGRFDFVYEKMLKGKVNNVYFSVIPDKNYYLAEDAGQLHIDYDEFYKRCEEGMDFAEFIDIRGTLSADSYYKTDTHWRQECLEDTAATILRGMGKTPSATYEKRELDVPFRGVYYGQAALPLSAETIYYLTNDTIENAKAYDFEHERELSVYDMTKKDGYDPYEVFLGGPISLVTMENKSSDGGHLVIFRDSFGSSLSPLLLESYSKITLVDIRYLMPTVIPMVVRDLKGADVLFLYSSSVLNNGDTIK